MLEADDEMKVGIVQMEVSIPWANSLKDKRRAIRSLKERISSRYNVSVAEVGDNEVWRSSVLGLATVANDAKFIQGVCQKVVNFVEEDTRTNLEDFTIEII